LSLFNELQRRNVFRVTVAYVISAWLLAQVADLVLDNIGAPAWVMQSILLVLGLGLVPVVFFSWAYEVTPEGIKHESEIDRSESITHVTGRKLDRTIMAILAIAVVYFAVDKFVLAPATPAAGAVPAAAEMVATDYSIAVLPFVNMSDDEANEYFSDGLSEELLNELARNPELQVAARTSSFALKDEKLEIGEIARRLDVAHVLEGSVRKSGNQIRVTAQLIRADNGYHLWSDTYDRDLDNIFAIQDDIADRITAALLPHIVGENAAVATDTTTESFTPSVTAYQTYLLARDNFNRRTSAEVEKALELLQDLVREFPEYAEAHALLAHVTYLHSRRVGGEIPWVVAEQQVRRALDKATDLDPEIAEIYLVEGQLHARSYRPNEAIGFYERAIELSPSYADAYRALSQAAFEIGQKERGWTALERARTLDPISVATLNQVIERATRDEKMELVEESFDVMEQVAPEAAADQRLHWYWDSNRVAEAAIALEDFRENWPDADPHDSSLARFYAVLGKIDAARSMDARVRAQTAAELGERELALDAMTEAAAERTDPHDSADIRWQVYLLLGMKEEAAEVLSDLWYGYAAEELGPRMDGGDVLVFIQLLRDLGRADEAAPIAEKFLTIDSLKDRRKASATRQTSARIVDGDIDGAMQIILEKAQRGKFSVGLTRLSPFYYPLEAHPDFPRLEAIFDEWRAGQIELYEKLSAARETDRRTAHE